MASLRNVLCVVPYKQFSGGAKILAQKLGVYRIPDPGLLRGGHHAINWGRTSWDVPVACKVYNKPKAVAVAVDKLLTYQALQKAGVLIPEFSTNIEDAHQWVIDGGVVLCRTLLQASEGRGIFVAQKQVDIQPAKVYTRYVRKKREYRVHVFQDKVIGSKRKIKRADTPVTDTFIRSHANGYRFVIDAANPLPKSCHDAAIAAVKALGLDFGGVDIAWVEKGDRAYVLEINCAPGLTEMTADWYVEAIMKNYAV